MPEIIREMVALVTDYAGDMSPTVKKELVQWVQGITAEAISATADRSAQGRLREMQVGAEVGRIVAKLSVTWPDLGRELSAKMDEFFAAESSSV